MMFSLARFIRWQRLCCTIHHLLSEKHSIIPNRPLYFLQNPTEGLLSILGSATHPWFLGGQHQKLGGRATILSTPPMAEPAHFFIWYAMPTVTG